MIWLTDQLFPKLYKSHWIPVHVFMILLVECVTLRHYSDKTFLIKNTLCIPTPAVSSEAVQCTPGCPPPSTLPASFLLARERKEQLDVSWAWTRSVQISGSQRPVSVTGTADGGGKPFNCAAVHDLYMKSMHTRSRRSEVPQQEFTKYLNVSLLWSEVVSFKHKLFSSQIQCSIDSAPRNNISWIWSWSLSEVLGLSHSTQNPTECVCVIERTGTCTFLPACVCTCADLCICKCVFGTDGYSEGIVNAGGGLSGRRVKTQ